MFSKDDIFKIFHSIEYKNDAHRHPYQYWLPILGLLTGCRIEELCQLYVEDVKAVNGTLVLDINQNRSETSVKAHEKRLVPLHPILTNDLRFQMFSAEIGGGRLFPELKRINNRYSHKAVEWFSKYKTSCGIEAEKGNKTFHCFRHTIADHLKQNHDLPEYVISELLGHKNENITTGRYGKKFRPEVLFEKAVLKLDFDIDLSHLKASKWVPKD